MNDTLLPGPRRLDWALLLIRIAPGLVFIYHGSEIFFGWFNGPGLTGFANMLHMPIWVAALVALAQLCGGLAILTGVLARLGALCTAVVMIGAILIAHYHLPVDVSKGGAEFAFTQLMVSLGLMITGAGDYSLVRLLPQFHHPHAAGTAVPQT
jgi:putative oxidoreductase